MNEAGSKPTTPGSEVRFDSASAKFLQVLLTIIGCGLMVAAVAVFLPVELMAQTHHWLGWGEFPDAPITRYLARSTSLLLCGTRGFDGSCPRRAHGRALRILARLAYWSAFRIRLLRIPLADRFLFACSGIAFRFCSKQLWRTAVHRFTSSTTPARLNCFNCLPMLPRTPLSTLCRFAPEGG